MNRVTVAICTYNRAQSGYLAQSLQSVINQTYKDIDIIVYDNASTDNTEEVVCSFKDSRITYVKNEKNLGLFGNLNKALANCKTEYIVVFHDDDIMLPKMIEIEVDVLDKHKDAAIAGQLFTNKSTFNIFSFFLKYFKNCKIIKYKIFRTRQFIINTIKQGTNIICCPSVMFRRQFIIKYGIHFEENLGNTADWFLWLK